MLDFSQAQSGALSFIEVTRREGTADVERFILQQSNCSL